MANTTLTDEMWEPGSAAPNIGGLDNDRPDNDEPDMDGPY